MYGKSSNKRQSRMLITIFMNSPLQNPAKYSGLLHSTSSNAKNEFYLHVDSKIKLRK